MKRGRFVVQGCGIDGNGERRMDLIGSFRLEHDGDRRVCGGDVTGSNEFDVHEFHVHDALEIIDQLTWRIR